MLAPQSLRSCPQGAPPGGPAEPVPLAWLDGWWPGTRLVTPQHAFDIGRLTHWLRGRVAGFDGEVTVEQF